MKANEFVKKFGWDEASSLVNAHCWTMRQIALSTQVNTDELDRLVKSHELVESFGGLDAAKKELNRLSVLRWINPETEKLRAAIADVESC